MNQWCAYLWLVLSLLPTLPAWAVDKEPVGRVLMAVGDVQARNGEENRKLERKSDIYPGDTLLTSKDSQLQLRMVDGAFIALTPDTAFEVRSYHFGDGPKADNVAVTLLKGGLRTVTGQIEKSNYRLATPAATLGIRGTVFEVYVAADGTTTVILREGGVDVSGLVGQKIKMDLANLASVIRKGGAAGQPGPIPPEIQQLLESILPLPPGSVGVEENGGTTVFTFDIDPALILTNPDTGSQPPTVSPDGNPPTEPAPSQQQPPPCPFC